MKTNIITNNTIMNNVFKYICAVLLVLCVSGNAWGGLVTDTYDYSDMSGQWSGSYSDQTSYWKITGTATVTLPVSEQPTSNITVIVKMAYFGDGTEALEKVSATGTESSSNWTLSESSMDKHPNGSTYKNCSFTITKAGSPTSLSNLAITFNKKAGKDLRIQKITISYTSSSAASISVTRSGNPVPIIDFGTITEAGTDEWTFDVSGTGLTTGYYDEYFIVSVDGDDVFYDPDYGTDYGYIYSNPDQFKVGYHVTDPGTYNGTVTVGAYKTKAAGGYYDGEWFQVTIPITITYEAEDCTVDPTIGAASLNGAISSNTSVAVQCTSASVGSDCAWTDYGFVWGTATSPTIGGSGCTKVQVGTSGSVTSFTGNLTSTFTTGTTYYYRAYGKNSKDGAAFVYSSSTSSFIIRSITFNSNGGSAVTTKYVQSGSTATAPTAPTKTGYTFGGWYQESELTNAVNWSSAVSENKTYYAKWTAKNYTITLDNQDATTPGTASIGVTYNSNTNLTGTPAITVPTKTGYTFGGYYTSSGGGGSQIIDADGNVNASVASYTNATKQWIYDGSKTLYAKWTGNSHTMTVGAPSDVTITATPAGGSAQAEGATPSVNYGTTVTLNYSSVTSGKYWAGWDVYKTGNAGTKVAVTGSGSGATFTMPDYDVTVTALLFGDLVAFCDVPIITLTTSDGDPAFVTSRFETSKNINIMSTKTLLLSIENVANGESVTISGTDLIFYTDNGTRYSVASLTTPVTSQVLHFSYKPSSAGDGSITEPRISVSVAGTTVNFDGKIKARNLPEKVAIVAKAGDTWMALPTPTSETTPEGTVVSVSDGTATGPASVAYKLWPVKTTNPSSTPSDRFGTATSTAPIVQYGDRLRFAAVSNDNKALWANNSTSSSGIKTANAITAIGADGAEPNEWKVETRIVDGQFVYKLQTQQSKNTNYLRYKVAADGGPKWGTYSSGDIVDVYILPLTEVTEAEIKVMEWGTNKIAVSYPNRASCTAMTAKIGSGATNSVTINPIGGDLYELTGVGDLQSNPGKSLALAVTEGGTKQKTFLIPYIATSSVAEATIRSAAGGDNAARIIDVVVRSGGTLTTGTASGAFNDLYVYPGGKADISNSIGLKHIYMRGGFSWLGGDYAHPQMKVTGSISGLNAAGCGIFYDLYLDNSMYYMFALPKDVAATAITNEENGDDWDAWIKSYSGEGRTLSPKVTGWSYLTSESTITRGAGYEIAIMPRLSRPYGILRFPLLKATAWSAETDPTPEIKGWGANDASVSDNNKGWNCIGNPYLTAYNNAALPGTTPSGKIQTKTFVQEIVAGNWTGKYIWSDSDVKYFTIPRFTEYEYDDVRAWPYKLEPFFPFFIQATGDGTISFSGSNRTLKMPSFYAEQTAREVFVDFQLQNAEGKTDVAGLTISDQYSENFDMQDKEKTIQNGNATMKVYTMVGEFRTAFNSLPEAVAAMPVPVGYIAPQEGKYNFSLVEGDYSEVEHVWLTDYVESETVDLLLDEPYEFETAVGAFNERFAITVILKPESPGSLTDTEVVEDEYAQPQKFIWQDQLYIFNNGRLYDATGRRVGEINK